MTKSELIKKLTFIASEEDDSENYQEERKKITDKYGPFQASYHQQGEDWAAWSVKDYYIIVDCGVRTLYKKKPLKQLSLFPE